MAPPGWGAGPSCGHPGGADDVSAGPGYIGVGKRMVAPGQRVPDRGWTGSTGLGEKKMLVARAGMVIWGRVCAHPYHRPSPGPVRCCWVAQAIRARRLAPGVVVRVLAAVGILSRSSVSGLVVARVAVPLGRRQTWLADLHHPSPVSPLARGWWSRGRSILSSRGSPFFLAGTMYRLAGEPPGVRLHIDHLHRTAGLKPRD